MTLKINEISGLVPISRMEEVVKTDLEQRDQRQVSQTCPADSRVLLILPMDHRHRVPANQRLNAALQHSIARIRLFFMLRNGVQIGRRQLARGIDPSLPRALAERVNQ